jgi:peptidoglycan-associated lipoprotein
MNNSSKILCLVLASAIAAFTGCTKKPIRPDPSRTVMSPNSATSPTDINIATDAAPGTALQQRDPNVIEDENTIRGLLQPVYFDFDRSAVKQAERPKIEAAAKYLKDNPDKRLLLEGHCDWRGTSEYNLGLGDRRANAVKKFFASLSITDDKLETLSKGSLGAIEKGTDDQMSKDRRVEFVILKK